MNKKNEFGFVSHLKELRQRLINSLIFLSFLFVICYFFSENIYGFLVDPYAQAVKNDDVNRRLIFTALQETFLTYLKVSFFAAFFVTSPYILIQIWKFIAPGLYEHEKSTIMPYLITSGDSFKSVPPMVNQINWIDFSIIFSAFLTLFFVVIASIMVSVKKLPVHNILRTELK